jgi:DNA uptake protein ComE-like DNA-binding protein
MEDQHQADRPDLISIIEDSPRIGVTMPERFAFDPNTLDEKGWQRLGVNMRTITTILNYRSKGGSFRQPSDLRKIYGINKEICEELIPYVTIEQIPSDKSSKKMNIYRKSGLPENKDPGHFNNSSFRHPEFKGHTVSVRSVDINSGDSAAWEQLPAIGSKLASRIILFRDRLGGFYNVRQVAETFGLSDSAFKIILPYLNNSQIPLRKININTVGAADLARHPYIRWNIANAIVNYRNQHGIFRDLSELRSVSVITPDIFEKLEPYVTVQ